MSNTASNVSVGVQELLEKLRKQGVNSGRVEGDKILAEARAQVEAIIAKANKEADAIVVKAKKDADFIENAGKDSLEMAARNTVLELKSYLLEKFSSKVRDTISAELANENLLQKMIVEVAGRAGISTESDLEVVLPQSVVGVQDLRDHPDKLQNGTLLYFVAEQARDVLKEGVTFSVGDKSQTGVTFRLKDKDIQVDLDENAVSDMLLRHLQPRFRALLEGIIH